jgi:hypothetical protein
MSGLFRVYKLILFKPEAAQEYFDTVDNTHWCEYPSHEREVKFESRDLSHATLECPEPPNSICSSICLPFVRRKHFTNTLPSYLNTVRSYNTLLYLCDARRIAHSTDTMSMGEANETHLEATGLQKVSGCGWHDIVVGVAKNSTDSLEMAGRHSWT